MIKVTQGEIDKEMELLLNSLHFKELSVVYTNLRDKLCDEDLTKSELIKMYAQHKKAIEMLEAFIVDIETKIEIVEEGDDVDGEES